MKDLLTRVFEQRKLEKGEGIYVVRYFVICERKGTVKQFLYRPGEPHRVPGGKAFHISRQSAHEGGKFVSLTHRPPSHPRRAGYTPGS